MNKNKVNGFTIAEVIIVMAVLAIIISVSYKDISRLFTKQLNAKDNLTMLEIKKALELYALNENHLPKIEDDCIGSSDQDNWHYQLSKYSNLSPKEICINPAGFPRHYQRKTGEVSYWNGAYKYKVDYATVLSTGSNKNANPIFWSKIKGEGDSFYNFDKNMSDDFIVVKYTDAANKLKLYKETLRRIEVLEEYLERYARSKRAAALSADVENLDKYILYPKSNSLLDKSKYYLDSDFVSVDDSSTKATDLTKVLGLPEYYGRDAVTGDPMLYVSNPGPKRTNPCSGAKKEPPYYPPKILPISEGEGFTGC